MPPRKDLSGLPTAQQRTARPPSQNPLFLRPVMTRWAEQEMANDDYAPAIPGRPYRASMAGLRCDRQLFYALTGVEPSEPRSVADVWRMKLGGMVHDGLQDVLDSLGNGWRRELIVDLRPIGIDGSAHADVAQMVCLFCASPIAMLEIVDSDSTGWLQWACRCSIECDSSETFEIERHASGAHTWSPEHERAEFTVEFKTVNGMGFKTMATTFRGPPEGARSGHILQGAMSAKALGCNQVIVAYLAMENVGDDLKASVVNGELGRFAAEWHYTVDELEPQIEYEVGRIRRLLAAAEHDVLPMRVLHDSDLPANAHIVNPMTKAWVVTDEHGGIVDQGSKWFCGYCDYRSRCVEDGAASVVPHG